MRAPRPLSTVRIIVFATCLRTTVPCCLHLLTRRSPNDLPTSRSVTYKEFNTALGELCLAPDEAAFLFQFWDTMAGQQEAQGAVDIQLVVTDLIGSVPTYSTGFNSGPEAFKSAGNKSNRSSVQGGIFGGGSYAADANGEAPQFSNRGPAYAPSAPAMAPSSNKPRGNQSSVEGGIFAGMDGSAPLAPQPSNRSNRSNQSSVQGGIFSEAPNCAPASNRGANANKSNQSSIPGGIFG